jgi:uncharacterized membrane protein
MHAGTLTARGGTDIFRRVSRYAVSFLPVIAATLLGLSTHPAAARFSVCNKTANPASIAIGFFNGKDWTSSGWWKVAPGGCAAVIDEPLLARYYYVYAEHEELGGAWEGDRSFCVGTGRFSIAGRGNCTAHGYETKRFFQVDTGNAPDWTENLAD